MENPSQRSESFDSVDEVADVTFAGVMMREDSNMTFTEKGALTYISSLDALVDLFYKGQRGIHESLALELFEKAYVESPLLTAKMIAYIRDVRGGKGERKLGRFLLNELSKKNKEMFEKNLIHYLATYGRWDDGVDFETEGKKEYVKRVVEQLKQDLADLEEGKNSISLCAKWIPSEGKSVDKKTGIYGMIAKMMGMKKDLFRKKCLAPLRKHLDIVETHLVKKEYDEINYQKVPSRCMFIHGKEMNKKKLPNAFYRNDGERFKGYVSSLAKGEAKVNAKDLYPHEIIATYHSGSSLQHCDVNELTEAQWKVMEEKMKGVGKLGKTLVLSDVSGSMSGLPMSISIALGILISGSIDHAAFKNFIVTFHETPTFYKVMGNTLKEKVESVSSAPWGGTTDFFKVFRIILDRATEYKLTEKEMPERIVVISDMQFDMASRGHTNFQAIDQLYKKHGYKRPQIVFWNVNGRVNEVPVKANVADTALVSGYSPDIMKAVLAGENLTPKDIMLKALSDSRYDLIVE
jgi:hypothetical protein